MFVKIYEMLLSAYGPRGWWPVTPRGGVRPLYSGGPRSAAQRFEVAAGAVLTQNTAWKNAARAIERLNEEGVLSPERILSLDEDRLRSLIRSAGYYNQKAKRLRKLAAFFAETRDITREALLGVEGIGPETADSIMLYGFDKPYFVVDAYTRRIFGRLGLVDERKTYEQIRESLEKAVPRRVPVYQEYHALLVEHAKRHCRQRPACKGCLLANLCGHPRGCEESCK